MCIIILISWIIIYFLLTFKHCLIQNKIIKNKNNINDIVVSKANETVTYEDSLFLIQIYWKFFENL